MKCSSCGKEHEGNFEFCPSCGKPSVVKKKKIGLGKIILYLFLAYIAFLIIGPCMKGMREEASRTSKQSNSVSPAPSQARIIPPESLITVQLNKSKESLVQEISGWRNSAGGIIVFGKIKLPVKTKVWVELKKNGKMLGQDEIFLSDSGGFESSPFTYKGKSHPAGNYEIIITSYFTKMWQSNDILSQTGEGGNLLSSAALVPDDQEFPKGKRHLEETFNASFPNLSGELAAIEKVKSAKLYVSGQGLSAEPIGEIVDGSTKRDSIQRPSWSAKQESPGIWIVTLNYMDVYVNRTEPGQAAQWEYNSKTGTVKYLNPSAKNFSWTPSE